MPRKQGDYRTRIWKFEDGLSNVLVIQLNKLIHMRDVFGTRLRRAEGVFPPVIGLLPIRWRLQTSVSVHLAQDLALKGLCFARGR